MNALIPRATVAQICAQRRHALALYGEAYQALSGAHAAMAAAHKAANDAAPCGVTSYSRSTEEDRKAFLADFHLPAANDFLARARRNLDISVWSHLIGVTDLERLMDKTAKDALRQALLSDPPEATEENIFATLQSFAADADMIFRRGIATCFSSLDRRFRSHTGWKIGSRVILTRAFNEWGSWNYHGNERDTMQDIERAFLVLDGKQQPARDGKQQPAIDGEDDPAKFVSIVRYVEASRKGMGTQQSVAESDYFRVRCFHNGNAHIWFKRDDLLDKVNKLLAEYYGEVIPEERGPDEDTGLNDPKTSLAKNYGFFPTTGGLIHDVIEAAKLWLRAGDAPLTLLEPSAGTGNLAGAAADQGAIVDCVEIQPGLADALRRSGKYRRVLAADFLALQPDPARLYDRVVMNPPFDRERVIDHVMHALKFLNPDGHLTAIMSAGTEFRTTKKSEAFRDLMKSMLARWRDLPPGSFSGVGTNVNTIMLTVFKSGRERP